MSDILSKLGLGNIDQEFPEIEPVDIGDSLEDVNNDDVDNDEDQEIVTKTLDNDFEDVDDATDNTNTDTEPNPIKVLAEFLKDSGVISVKDEELEGDEFDEDFIKNKVTEEITKGKDEFIDSIENGDYKDVVSLIKQGVPVSQAFQAVAQTSEYTGIDFTTLDENGYKQLIKDQMMMDDPDSTDEEIEDAIEAYELSNKLETMAEKSLKKLQKAEAAQRDAIKRQVEEQNRANLKKYEDDKLKFTSKINEAKEIIPGVPLTEGTKKIMVESEYKRDRDGKTKFSKTLDAKPELLDQIKFFVNVLEGDWSKISASLKTKAVQDLKNKIEPKTVTPKTKMASITVSSIGKYLNKNK